MIINERNALNGLATTTAATLYVVGLLMFSIPIIAGFIVVISTGEQIDSRFEEIFYDAAGWIGQNAVIFAPIGLGMLIAGALWRRSLKALPILPLQPPDGD